MGKHFLIEASKGRFTLDADPSLQIVGWTVFFDNFYGCPINNMLYVKANITPKNFMT